ncbi:hypothetical protein STEG23_025516, partial [Scotinomys teguina]
GRSQLPAPAVCSGCLLPGLPHHCGLSLCNCTDVLLSHVPHHDAPIIAFLLSREKTSKT